MGSENMNQHEVADLLRVEVGTLGKWRRRQRGPQPFSRIGNTYLYRRAEVERFLTEGAPGSRSARAAGGTGSRSGSASSATSPVQGADPHAR